jgi:hypothetical protein
MAEMLGLDPNSMTAAPEDETDLITNQRFEKLKRLPQLGIFVDEAHHAFGDKLAKDMGVKKATNSLRNTIDELAINLKHAGTSVVGCYNYTGTPYVGKDVLPEVVYAYSLKKAIDNNYLKQVKLKGYSNTRHEEFLEIAIEEFLTSTKDLKPEGMLPKMAIFGTTVDEIVSEVRPAVEKILSKHGISSNSILVNVGDAKITTNDDIREFNRLDTPQSEKQFILLVNKGREGWNCRSLFSVALYREPKSKIFVLQATMRCLRAIGNVQHTGLVFLTNENMLLLDKELQANFRISSEEMINSGSGNETYKVRVEYPQISIPIKRVRRNFKLVEKKDFKNGYSLNLDEIDLSKYRLIVQEQTGLITPEDMGTNVRTNTDISERRKQRNFSRLMLVAEIARYLNKPCLEIENILDASDYKITGILQKVNEFNELLYDEVIPRLFREMYSIEYETITEDFEVNLVKEPPIETGYYQVTAAKDKVVRKTDSLASPVKHKTFHLDTYCFDSNPERQFFWDMLKDNKVENIWFTGMLTHGQSEFVIHYVDSETQRVRSYYPDFLIKKQDGSYVMVEVKGEHMIDSQNVKDKKDAAELLGIASGMKYEIIAGKQADDGSYGREFLL